MLTFNIDNITKSERDAFTFSTKITDQIKALLQNKEVVTIEKITGTEELGAEATLILQQYIDIINSPEVVNSVNMINTLLGGIMHNLAQIKHDGHSLLDRISHFIDTCEHLFRKRK